MTAIAALIAAFASVLPALGAAPFWPVWLFILAFVLEVMWLLLQGLETSAKRGWWIARLRHDGFRRRYREFLAAALDWFDRRLSPDWPEDADAAKTEPGRAWSHGLLNWCLLLAFVYPVMSIGFQWSLTGEAAGIGTSVLLEAAEGVTRLAISGGIFFIAIAAFFLFLPRAQIRDSAVVFLLGTSVIFFFDQSLMGYEFGFIQGETSIVFGALALFVWSLISFRDIIPDLKKLGPLALIFFSCTVLMIPFAEKIVITIFLSALFIFHFYLGFQTGHPTFFLLVFVIALFGALTWVVKTLAETFSGEGVLFLGLLPLLNAAADFGSTGLTRYCLRRGVRRSLGLNAALDALAAAAIFLLLAGSIVAVLHWVRPQEGPSLADLPGMLADLRGEEAHRYYWLYACLFSTLLPTALHLCVAAFGLFTAASGWVGQPLAERLKSGDARTARLAVKILTFCAALALVLPAFLIWAALYWGGRAILDATLFLMTGFAQWIGAL